MTNFNSHELLVNIDSQEFLCIFCCLPGRHIDDVELWTHTNDTLYSVRRQILEKVKANNANMKVDLYVNGDLVDPTEKKLVSQLPLKETTVCDETDL